MANRYRVYIHPQPRQNQQFSGQLGSVGGMRRIEIIGTGNIASWLTTVAAAENYLRNQLVAQGGWQLMDFDFRQTSYTRLSGLDFSINIVANVPDGYTDQNHLDFLSALMQNYVVSYGVGQSQAITDLHLETKGGGNSSAIGNSSAGASIGAKDPVNNSDFTSVLAQSLGISTPLAVVGGVLLFVYLMKR